MKRRRAVTIALISLASNNSHTHTNKQKYTYTYHKIIDNFYSSKKFWVVIDVYFSLNTVDIVMKF